MFPWIYFLYFSSFQRLAFFVFYGFSTTPKLSASLLLWYVMTLALLYWILQFKAPPLPFQRDLSPCFLFQIPKEKKPCNWSILDQISTSSSTDPRIELIEQTLIIFKFRINVLLTIIIFSVLKNNTIQRPNVSFCVLFFWKVFYYQGNDNMKFKTFNFLYKI